MNLFAFKNSQSITLARLIFFFVAYSITGIIGLHFGNENSLATVIWFPSGIALAAVLVFGFEMLPAIAAGAFVVNLFTGSPIFAAAGVAVGNTLAVFAGTYILRRVRGQQVSIENLYDVIAIIGLAAIFSTTISATIGTVSIWMGGTIKESQFAITWKTWWLGDMLGVLVIAPFILQILKGTKKKRSKQNIQELVVFTFISLFVSFIVFFDILRLGFHHYQFSYIVFPITAFAALRFGPSITAATNFFLLIIAVAGTAFGLGPFIAGTLTENLFSLQLFIGISTTTSMIMAAAISEREHSEKALRESEIKFRSVFEHSIDAIGVSIEGTHIFVNQAYVTLFGYTNCDEIAGTPIIKLIAPSEREKILDFVQKRAKGETVATNYETLGFRKDNSEFVMDVNISFYEIEGEKYTLVILRDITERKKSEEIMRLQSTALESAVNGIIITKYDGVIEWVNSAFGKITGYTLDEAIGKKSSELVKSGKMTDEFYKQLWKTITAGKFWQGETINRKKDGTLYTDEQTITPVINAKGEITHFIGIKQNITERKNNEQIIQDVQRRESIGVLAGGIAHDFNNLLNAMMGNISLAQTRLAPDHPAVKNIERALSAMERAALLTKQLLAYSGKGKFQIREIDLVALVKEHINLFEVSLSKNITFACSLPEDSVHVKGDPGQIEQVIMNLIINAGDAIGEKQGTVFIKVTSETMSRDTLFEYSKLTDTILNAGEYALIEVMDNGSGISSETMSKIFDPFFTTKTKGRGLGLSAVLGILRGHEGGLTIKTLEGSGTTFRVLLPLVQVNESFNASSNLNSKLVSAVDIKILVIDDEQYILDVVDEILETRNYQRLLAKDPVAGITLYEDQWQTIDAVILDYSMPKMNGKEVFIALRKINPDVKIIISSGFTEDEIIDRMGNIKPTWFIQKPHTKNALLTAVSKVLEFDNKIGF